MPVLPVSDGAAAPEVGACQDWVAAADVFDCRPCSTIAVGDQDVDLAAEVAATATDLLFRLSDRRYPGSCVATVRPCARRSTGPQWTADASWGVCRCQSPDVRACGCSRLDAIRLGVDYPIIGITQVREDGVALTEGVNYRVDDSAWLTRIDGEGWPCCQSLDLAATAVGTWDVTFSYGRAPSTPGVAAAKALACELYRLCATGTCNLPQRVRTIARQGIEVGFIDPMEFLAEGKTGVYPVDLFLSAERYDARHRGTAVVNPDVLAQVTRTGT